MSHFSHIIAIVGAIFLVLCIKRSQGQKTDKHLLILFSGLVFLWGTGNILDTVISSDLLVIKTRIQLVAKFCGGCSAGVFLSLWINGGWRRFTRKNDSSDKPMQ